MWRDELLSRVECSRNGTGQPIRDQSPSLGRSPGQFPSRHRHRHHQQRQLLNGICGRALLLLAVFCCGTLLTLQPVQAESEENRSEQSGTNHSERLPNVVLIFTDDLGYADIGCFGATGYATPHIDRLAEQGRRFTSFYVSQAVCSASRAALLTGCYNNRISITGALNPKSQIGIHDDELMLAELLKQKQYATAAIGKWHLGHHRQFLPLQHGFDLYFGLPYSNDMWPYHPAYAHLPLAEARVKGYPDLPLISGNDVFNPEVTPDDQTRLTRQYTEQAVKFIDAHHEQPFLLYLAHSMPHVPLFASDQFVGKTEAGLFGDVLEEIDWSVGQVLERLQRYQLDDHTLVIFTSDNGPWLSYGNHAGSAGPFREGKGTTFEGGVRVPCVMRWPGKIPAGTVCSELAATIDVLPTVAALTGTELPAHPIDGHDIRELLFAGPEAKTPHTAYYYYYGNQLEAIRADHWKLHFPHTYRSLSGKPGRDGQPDGYSQQKIELSLFHLDSDPGELRNVAEQHPDVVERLQQLAEQARQELGDSARNQKGRGVRPAGRVAAGP